MFNITEYNNIQLKYTYLTFCPFLPRDPQYFTDRRSTISQSPSHSLETNPTRVQKPEPRTQSSKQKPSPRLPQTERQPRLPRPHPHPKKTKKITISQTAPPNPKPQKKRQQPAHPSPPHPTHPSRANSRDEHERRPTKSSREHRPRRITIVHLAPPPHIPRNAQPRQCRRARLSTSQQARTTDLRTWTRTAVDSGTAAARFEGVYGYFQYSEV